MPYPQFYDDVAVCRKLHKKHGTSYYWAAKFFPKDMRYATYILYGFFRVADEIVDTEAEKGADAQKKKLDDWKREWKRAYVGEAVSDPVLRATAYVFHVYGIPATYADAFLDAMATDLSVSRYRTYVDLEKYMYGSAAVVGLMMSHVIGFSDPKALEHAKALGEAMQFTNFLRDIKEDFTRGRIYIPEEDMVRFGVSAHDFELGRITPSFIALMRYEIERCHRLYGLGNAGIPYLSPKGRFPVASASFLYAGILREIEQANYDVFSTRCRTSFLKKINLLLRAKRFLSSV